MYRKMLSTQTEHLQMERRRRPSLPFAYWHCLNTVAVLADHRHYGARPVERRLGSCVTMSFASPCSIRALRSVVQLQA